MPDETRCEDHNPAESHLAESMTCEGWAIQLLASAALVVCLCGLPCSYGLSALLLTYGAVAGGVITAIVFVCFGPAFQPQFWIRWLSGPLLLHAFMAGVLTIGRLLKCM